MGNLMRFTNRFGKSSNVHDVSYDIPGTTGLPEKYKEFLLIFIIKNKLYVDLFQSRFS